MRSLWLFAAFWILVSLPNFVAQTAQAAPLGMVYTHQYQQRLDQLQSSPLASPPDSMDLDFLNSSQSSGSKSGSSKASKKLIYHGGPVLSNVKVYAVMWGPQVNAETQSGIGDMLSATADSTYFDLFQEYDTTINAASGRSGTQQRIGRGTYAGLLTIEPSNVKLDISDDEIGVELEHQINAGALPAPDANTVYMTYFPPGMTINLLGAQSCREFCGYHHSYNSQAFGAIYYSVEPDLSGDCSLGCGQTGSQFADLTVVSSHELSEAVTDPAAVVTGDVDYPDAWNTSQGSEIGDLCASVLTRLTTSSGTVYTLQTEFDNASLSCAKGPYHQ